MYQKIFVMPRKLHFYDLRQFRHAYWQGQPESRIARLLGVSRPVVRRLIRENGLLPRDHLASNQYLAQERCETLRKAYTAAAHAARRRHPRGSTTRPPA
jgi:hypothetical protein